MPLTTRAPYQPIIISRNQIIAAKSKLYCDKYQQKVSYWSFNYLRSFLFLMFFSLCQGSWLTLVSLWSVPISRTVDIKALYCPTIVVTSIITLFTPAYFRGHYKHLYFDNFFKYFYMNHLHRVKSFPFLVGFSRLFVICIWSIFFMKIVKRLIFLRFNPLLSGLAGFWQVWI